MTPFIFSITPSTVCYYLVNKLVPLFILCITSLYLGGKKLLEDRAPSVLPLCRFPQPLGQCLGSGHAHRVSALFAEWMNEWVNLKKNLPLKLSSADGKCHFKDKVKIFFPVTQNKMHFLGGGENVHFYSLSLPLCHGFWATDVSTGSSSLLLFGPLHLFKGDRVAQIEPVASPDMWSTSTSWVLCPSCIWAKSTLVGKCLSFFYRGPNFAQSVKNLPAMQKTWIRFLGREDSLEKEMATHSSVLAWRIPMDRGVWQVTVQGVTRVGHDLATKPPLPPISNWINILKIRMALKA